MPTTIVKTTSSASSTPPPLPPVVEKKWKVYKTYKFIKRLGFDPIFFFSKFKFRKKKKVPWFGYVYLFKRIYALPFYKRRLFFSAFQGFNRFKPQFLFYRRLHRRGRKTFYSRIVSSLKALRCFYGFRSTGMLKKFLRLSRVKKKTNRFYVRSYSKKFTKRRKLFFRKRFLLDPLSNQKRSTEVDVMAQKQGVYTLKHRLMFASVQSKVDVLKYTNFCRRVHFLEFRIFTVLLRSGFYQSPVSIFRSIRSGVRIFVNSKPVSSPHFCLEQGDVITFSVSEARKIKLFLARVLRGALFDRTKKNIVKPKKKRRRRRRWRGGSKSKFTSTKSSFSHFSKSSVVPPTSSVSSGSRGGGEAADVVLSFLQDVLKKRLHSYVEKKKSWKQQEKPKQQEKKKSWKQQEKPKQQEKKKFRLTFPQRFYFFERSRSARHCRRFSIFCLPFSRRHFVVKYSIPAILISSKILHGKSLGYPFSKQIIKPGVGF